MTFEAKCKLIDDMIKENPETTIKDYMALVKEIESIERAASRREPTKLVMFQGRDKSGRFTKVQWFAR